MKKGRTAVDDREDNVRIQEFLDMIAPSVIKFETDHFLSLIHISEPTRPY